MFMVVLKLLLNLIIQLQVILCMLNILAETRRLMRFLVVFTNKLRLYVLAP